MAVCGGGVRTNQEIEQEPSPEHARTPVRGEGQQDAWDAGV